MQSRFNQNYVLKVTKPEIIQKGWGQEVVISNSGEYCGKILQYNTGAVSSFHFHLSKRETWYVQSGEFYVITTNPDTGAQIRLDLKKGDVLEIKPGMTHQVTCIVHGDIFEVSTPHYDYDTYRIAPGDSQTKYS